MLRSASIEMRLRNVSAINACLLIVAGLFGTVSLRVAQVTVQDVVSRLDPLAETNREARQALTDAQSGLRDFELTGAEPTLAEYRRGVDEFDALVARATALAGGDAEVLGHLQGQEAAGRRWVDDWADPLIELRRADPAAARARVVTGDGVRVFGAFRNENATTQAAIGGLQRRVAERVRNAITVMTLLGVVTTIAAAAVGLALARRAARWVSRPLQDLGGALDRMTGGDLTTRVTVAGPVEIITVAHSLNEMAGEMARLTMLERRRASEERLIRETSREFLQHLDEEGVLRVAVARVADALEADRTAIWGVLDDDAAGLRAVWPELALWEGPPVGPPPELVGMVRTAFGSYGLARIDDVDDDPDLPAPARAYLQQLGVRSIVLAPLSVFEEIDAVLCVERRSPDRPMTDSDAAVTQGIARELGVAMEHARVFTTQQATLDDLRRLDEAKAMFVSSVSHELRTPLTSIVGYTELVLDGDAGEVGDAQRDMITVVDRNARRLLVLIDDLLILSRFDAGPTHRSRTSVDVGEVIDAALGAVRPLLANRHLTVRAEHAPSLPPVWGDAGELERVVMNLLGNAFKFTGDGGSVTVTASAAGGEVAIAVTDTGAGIPDEEQQQIFSRFFRSSVTRDAQIPGTGLGLPIVQGIVKDHNGRIEIRSVVGAGTTFTVRLPAVGPSDGHEPPADMTIRSVPGPGPEY